MPTKIKEPTESSLDRFIRDVKEGKYTEEIPSVVDMEYSRIDIQECADSYSDAMCGEQILYGIN